MKNTTPSPQTAGRRLPVNPAASQQEANVQAYSAGVYFYTLLADGVPIATRRLVVQ